jgi:hypothetical protein
MRVSSRTSLAVAFCAAWIASPGSFQSSASASTAIPPPTLQSSCAGGNYTAADEALAASEAGKTGSTASEPEVVLGAKPENTSGQIKMGREVTVCVKGLYNWIYVQKKLPTDLHLIIGGEKFTSSNMSATLGPPGQEYVNFTMRIDSPDSPDWKAWANIVDASRHSSHNKLSISIYTTAQVFESTAVTTVPPFPDGWPWLAFAFIVLLAVLAGMAWKTPLLRYTAESSGDDKKKAPFSLGSVQMAWWFYLAVAAYVYICVSTLQIHLAMGSVLGLLGISATTGLAAVAVDAGKTSKANSQKNSLLAEQTALQARIAEINYAVPAAGSALETELIAKSGRLTQVNALVAQLPPATPSAISKGFFNDILSDGDGISFHRFQIAAWTVVLGSVFVWGVYRNMAMPDFDPSLLTLMGISSSTYVGFKIPEPKKT